DSKEVFLDCANYGAWPTLGGAIWVGQISAGGSLIGADAAAHLSEEVKDAVRTVPRAMAWSALVNGTMGLGALLINLYVIQDIETQVVQSMAPYPFVDIWLAAIGSHQGAAAL
ncbi:hypothetical protein LTR12_018494, partial [Friedmanniomyces endolithicus]